MDTKKSIDGISIIICCYNSEQRISKTLTQVLAQNFDKNIYKVEIILINNNSTDNTIAEAKKTVVNAEKEICFKIIDEEKYGKANALEAGYNAAQYELMLVCDDDNWLIPNYIQLVFDRFKTHPNIGLLGGFGIAYLGTDPTPSWFEKYKFHYVCGKQNNTSGYLPSYKFNIWGAGSVLRKSVWLQLNAAGFSFINGRKKQKAMGEDAELSMAVAFAGAKLFFDEQLIFYHDLSGNRVTWDKFIDQVKLNGRCSAVLFLMMKIHELKDYTLETCIKTISKEIKNYRFSKFYIEPILFFNNIINDTGEVIIIKRRATRNELYNNRDAYIKLIPAIYNWIKKIEQ